MKMQSFSVNFFSALQSFSNAAATTGNLIHDVFQQGLETNNYDEQFLREYLNTLLRQSARSMPDNGGGMCAWMSLVCCVLFCILPFVRVCQR